MRAIRTLMGCCVAIAAALSTASISAGEEAEGIAQVSHCDDGCADGACGCDTGSCGSGCCEDGCCGDGCGCGECEGPLRRQMRTLTYGWNGEADWCPAGGHCTHGCRNGQCGHCNGWLAYKLNCIFGVHHGATHSPGHGYVMPVKRPMWDVSYPYNHMYNATAVGQANGQQSSSPYGNVYMPTDTTQLGYSYGHVPYWMPRAGMVPPTPNPEAYHLRTCLPNRCSGKCGGTCQACQSGHGCPSGQCGTGNGQVIHHGSVMTPGQPVQGPREVTTEPTLAPAPE